MFFLHRFLSVAVLVSISYAGVLEKRQAAETFVTCTPAYNPRFCPDPYCVCTQPSSIVNVYAATTGATVCPTAGAAVSEAGCQIVVESNTDSTCGTVVFNTAFCLPSSTASTASTSPSTQVQPQAAAPLTTAPVTTSVPSYTIVSEKTCVSNGVTLPTTLTPLQTCGTLTAPFNCAGYDVLPYNTFDPESASFTGCACGDTWDLPPITSLQILRGIAQRSCNPSWFSEGPWVEGASVTNTPGYYDVVPNCQKWLVDNSADPTPASNPCTGYPATVTGTASCTYLPQIDALGQADDECACSNKSPKYTTNWFGDCPSSSYVTFTSITTIGKD